MLRATALEIHDADGGVGAATVDCPRRHQRMPILVCEACEHCVHSSRPADTKAWLLVCDDSLQLGRE